MNKTLAILPLLLILIAVLAFPAFRDVQMIQSLVLSICAGVVL